MKNRRASIKNEQQLQRGFLAALLISLAMIFFSCSGPKEMLEGDQHLRSLLGQANDGRIKSTILSVSDSSIQIMYVNTSADSVGVRTYKDLAFFKSCLSDSLLFQPEKKVSGKGFIMVGGFGYRRMYKESAETGFPKFNLIAPGDSLKVTASLKERIDSKT
ncbi:hypothetical protein O3Q51_12095 [Cryomorphaceae bacterium 1068]|nr:hypothetical protein [Cryomorphaceae bacterium 1068]